MPDLVAALLLGIIEGITEFLPISSTGHLLIAEHWLGTRSDLFNIAIQAGAILAVVAIYRQRLWSLLAGFAQTSNRDYALKLILAFGVTGALGLAVKKLGFQLPETLEPVAWALLIGGFVILAVEAIDARRADLPDADPNAIGWGTAALVGLAQVLAGVFPGTSRSAAAIFAALLFGRSSRVAATEFAFLVGIPTMFAATGYELLHTLKDGGAANEDWGALGVAFVVSALTAFAAVKWLLRYIQTHRFTVFAWYRIALGGALLVWLQVGAGPAAAQAREQASPSLPQEAATATAPAVSSSGGSRPHGRTALRKAREKEAAAERFAQVHACYQAHLAKSGEAVAFRLRLKAEARARADSGKPESNYQRYEREQGEFIEALVARTDGRCEDPADFSRATMSAASLRAAELGDSLAAECYVVTVPVDLPAPDVVPQRQMTAQELAGKQAWILNSRRLIANGLARGDWRMAMVALMEASEGTSYRGIDLHDDPTRYYRMARLLQNGLTDAKDGAQMQRVADAERASLSPEQLREADAWVQGQFPRFARTPPIDYGNLCGLPGQPRPRYD